MLRLFSSPPTPSKTSLYADDLLKEFADRLYRNFNSPGRAAKKAKSSWTGTTL